MLFQNISGMLIDLGVRIIKLIFGFFQTTEVESDEPADCSSGGSRFICSVLQRSASIDLGYHLQVQRR